MDRRTFLCGSLTVGINSLLLRPAFGATHETSCWHERMRPLMGSFTSIALYHSDDRLADKIISGTFTYIEQIISQISEWEPESAASKLNRERSLLRSECPEVLQEILTRSAAVSRMTRGKFSVLSNGLNRVWREAQESGSSPSSGEISLELKRTASSALLCSPLKIELTGDAGVSFGAIGKGFVADLAREYLRRHGIGYARIDCGGDLALLGDTEWWIDIEHPRSSGTLGTITIRGDWGVATSGDYRETWLSGDTRHHHLIDLATGSPSEFAQSVTVISRSATLADALSTAFACMPHQGSLTMARSLPETALLVVNAEGELHLSRTLDFSRA